MTRVLLLSDTHGHLDERILAYAQEADEIWHAGDIGSLEVTDKLSACAPLRGVYGNIDGHKARREFPEDLVFHCEQVKVWITHIGGYPGRYSPGVRERIAEIRPKLFICGHSHILKVQWDRKHQLLHMNPGACGIHGFHTMRTMLRFLVDGSEVKELEVVELGPRGGTKSKKP